ncbi:MAG: hypothetical protein LBD74_08085 [Spirochaetaceae bacterium]|nr:hypothetical protein [Spirochaetaceae bacterium]
MERMKKLGMAAVLVLVLAGAAGAQGRWLNSGSAAQSVTGALALRTGRIVLEAGGETYYVRGLSRFVGFIDGLKEGAKVTVEGYVYGDGFSSWLQPVKLTLNGKDYEVAPTLAQGGYPGGGYGGRNRGYGRGWCH